MICLLESNPMPRPSSGTTLVTNLLFNKIARPFPSPASGSQVILFRGLLRSYLKKMGMVTPSSCLDSYRNNI
nr:MAG TPA: hypothetical protein [Caudoviricetes sp.]